MAVAAADNELVSQLFKLQAKHSKLVKSSVYNAPADPAIKVRSWKMSEHQYYTVPSPFPTLARGIFTTWISEDNSKGEESGRGSYRIVARGYDKFFNMGEVPWTTVCVLSLLSPFITPELNWIYSGMQLRNILRHHIP